MQKKYCLRRQYSIRNQTVNRWQKQINNDRLPSKVLGLELSELDDELRFYDPIKSEWLPTPTERAEITEDRAKQEFISRKNAEDRAEQEAIARKNAEDRALQETIARQDLESDLAEALAEIERLRALTEQ